MAINNTINTPFPVSLAKGGTGANLSDPNADRILFWDDSAAAVTWLTPGTGLSITGTTITATAATGDVLQVVQTINNTQSSTTSSIPADDTKPQSSEGIEFMTVSITPESATSTLYVSAYINFSGTQGTPNFQIGTAAIFKDSGTDALSASNTRNRTDDDEALCCIPVFWSESSTNTNSRTFKIRVGCDNPGTLYLNQGVNPIYSDTVYSILTVMEVA